MAFTNSGLHLRAGAPGELLYHYDAGADAIATVAAAGYFHNATYNTGLVVEDMILVHGVDGLTLLQVTAVSAAGSITTQGSGIGGLALLAAATGTAVELNNPFTTSGYLEVGTSISTASRYVLPAPAGGIVFHVQKVDSGTQVFEFDAGGSGATGVTFDGTNRRIVMRAEGEGFRVRGSSATRWRIEYLNHHASAVSEGASVVMPGT